jgi:hypothetical protein
VASAGELAALEACIRAAGPVCSEQRIELVVARATSGEEIKSLQQRFPQVLFMPAPDGSTIQQLRAFGLAAAEGDIVVLTDDSHACEAAWIRAMTQSGAG